MVKLTLSVDESVLKKARRLARAGGTSISSMFSRFIESMAPRGGRPRRIGPRTRQACGLVRLPRGKDYRDVLAEALMDKYGLGK